MTNVCIKTIDGYTVINCKICDKELHKEKSDTQTISDKWIWKCKSCLEDQQNERRMAKESRHDV